MQKRASLKCGRIIELFVWQVISSGRLFFAVRLKASRSVHFGIMVEWWNAVEEWSRSRTVKSEREVQ